MNKLEKYSLEAVQKTLTKCSGITICVVSPNAARAHELLEYTIHSCTNEIERYSGFKLQFKNGSVVAFISSSRPMDICGRRYNQVFIDEGATEEFIETVARPLVSCYSGRSSAIFRCGVFELFNETDEVKRAAAKAISGFSRVSTLSQLNLALENAKKLVQEVAR